MPRMLHLSQSPYWLLASFSALMSAVLLTATGCDSSSSGDRALPNRGEGKTSNPDAADNSPDGGAEEDAGEPLEAKNADEVFQKMAAVYRQAKSYRDAAQVEFRFTPSGDGKADREDIDCSVAFTRPDKIRIRSQFATVAADGDRFRATIKDEHFAGDVLDIESPDMLTMDDILKDEVLSAFLLQSMGGLPVQVVLLLADDPLTAILDGAKEKTLLPPEKIDGRWNHKIRVDREDGALSFWIDQRTSVLRRLDFPTGALQQAIASQGAVGEVSLVVDFRDIKLNGEINPALFEMDLPKADKAVPRFNSYKLQDPPRAPLAKLGQSVDDFTLTDLEGNKHTRESLAGKVVVLDFWATWCQPCMVSLPNLQKVYQKFADNEQIVFLAVSIDEPGVTNEELTERFTQLGVKIPIVRGDDSVLKALGAVQILLPSLAVLGPDGVMQDSEVGYNPALGGELPPRLEKLLAGESLHEAALARHDAKLVEHYRRVNASPEELEGEGNAQIAPRDEPKTIKLTRQWSSSDLTEPGNILVVPAADGPPKIFVHDGWRHVVELNAEGQTVARHALNGIPADSVTTLLRTAVDGTGKRYFLALASAQSHVFVYDEEWQLVLKYPEESSPDGVADAHLADLDADGDLDLAVSYWGTVGVQRADLDGKRRWKEREAVENVYSLAVVPSTDGGTSRLLCANGHDGGYLMLLSSQGEREEKVVVPHQHLFKLAAADLMGDGTTKFCGYAPTATGNQLLLGFDLSGTEQWRQELAAGNHQAPVESLAFGRLLPGDAAHWLVAGPDGAILFIAANGTLADSFHFGEALHGLASAEINGQRVLLVSTQQKVEAWLVEP